MVVDECTDPDVLSAGAGSGYRGLSEYVPVIFAHSTDDAEAIKDTLEDCGIPTLIDLDGGTGLWVLARRVPVLVPEEMQEEASEVVAQIERRVLLGLEEDEDEYVDDDDLDDDADDPEDTDDDLYEDDDDL